MDNTDTLTVAQLPKQVPTESARYHMFNFKHTHEGDYIESFGKGQNYKFGTSALIIFPLVFIYSMPGYNCSIKERMLYSSCKAPLLDVIENHLNVAVAKKVSMRLDIHEK